MNKDVKREWIVILIEVREQADFFLRFQNAAAIMGYQILFIAIRYSVYKYLRCKCAYGNKTIFLTKNFVRQDVIVPDLSNDIETKTGKKEKQLSNVYRAIWGIWNNINGNVKYICMVNGCKVGDHALRDIAQKYNIKTLFFELSNIPGKVFVDPKGTNACAEIFFHKEILQRYVVRHEDYTQWKEKYIQQKLQEITVKQANVNGLQLALCSWFMDIIGRVVYHGVEPRGGSIAKIKSRIRKLIKQNKDNDDIFVPKDISYIFFPLQVSNDTNIVIHARKNMKEALKQAINIAKNKNCWLVVKPHPVEPYPSYLKAIIKESSYKRILITRGNTFQLILHAEQVFTINSTVGLEALILQKPVIIVGKALYENFSYLDVEKYIGGYLVNIDFWGDKSLTAEELSLCLKRSEICNKI